MTREEFRNALNILLRESTDLPMQVAVEELVSATEYAKELAGYEVPPTDTGSVT